MSVQRSGNIARPTAPFFALAAFPLPRPPPRLGLATLALVPAPERIPVRLFCPRQAVAGVPDPLRVPRKLRDGERLPRVRHMIVRRGSFHQKPLLLSAEQDLLGAVGDAEPQFLRGVPPGAEIQQGLLPDPAIDPGVADQVMGLAGSALLFGMRLGGIDEHGASPAFCRGCYPWGPAGQGIT